jgi:hypothetical protein
VNVRRTRNLGVCAHVRRLKQRPDIGAPMATCLAHEQRLEIRQPDIIGPTVCVEHDRMRTSIIAAVDDAVVHDFAALLKSYRVNRVTGDRYAGEFPRELFRKHGVAYDLAKQTKSELFRDLLPLLNSGRIVLPRNDRLQGQIVGLERRTSAVGRDTISHPDRGHDDVANAVAGAAALSKFGGYDTSLLWVSGPDDDSGAAWERVRFQAFINSGGRIRL